MNSSTGSTLSPPISSAISYAGTKILDPYARSYKITIAVMLVLIIVIIWKNDNIRYEAKRFITHNDSKLEAICVIIPTTECPNVRGTVKFTENIKKGVTTIKFELFGVRPGEHGAHIHTYGNILPVINQSNEHNCCANVGDHYNPGGKLHGSLDSGHMGDLGNILADDNGTVDETFVSNTIRLSGPYSVIGRALVIHENKDDLGHGKDAESKKTGNSGVRIACGVVALQRAAS